MHTGLLLFSPVEEWQLWGFKTANSELQLRTGAGLGTDGELDELSPLPQHCELTVNIRGNDIDLKVLWLQMSLRLSLSVLRKTYSWCDLHFFSFLCLSVPLLGKNCPHCATLRA